MTITGNFESLPDLAALIQGIGYKAKILDEDLRVISSAASGFKFVIVADDDGDLLFTLSINNDRGFTAETANEFNRDHRYAKAFVGMSSDGNDIILQTDLTLPADGQADWLEEAFGRWEISIEHLRKKIDSLARTGHADPVDPPESSDAEGPSDAAAEAS